MYLSLKKYIRNEFLINRFFRIYPVLFVAVVLYYISAISYSKLTLQPMPDGIINVKSFFWDVSLFRDFHLSQWSWGLFVNIGDRVKILWPQLVNRILPYQF